MVWTLVQVCWWYKDVTRKSKETQRSVGEAGLGLFDGVLGKEVSCLEGELCRRFYDL